MESARHIIRLCSSRPCHSTYRGEDFIKIIEEELGIKPGQTSLDAKYRLEIYDCLGMCFHAPAMMVNDQRYEDLSADEVRKILRQLKAKP